MKYYIYANLSLPKSNKYEEGDPSIRLNFTNGEDRIGHAYISGFDSPNGFLYNFRIYERFQDQGYGSDCLEYMLERYRITQLTVHQSNLKAIHLYEKFGFEIVDEFNDDNEWYFVMKKEMEG